MDVEVEIAECRYEPDYPKPAWPNEANNVSE